MNGHNGQAPLVLSVELKIRPEPEILPSMLVVVVPSVTFKKILSFVFLVRQSIVSEATPLNHVIVLPMASLEPMS